MEKLVFFTFFLAALYGVITQSAKLDTQELDVLKRIVEKIGLPVNEESWSDVCSSSGPSFAACQCFDSNTTCHVTTMDLFSKNLTSALPSEFAELEQLTNLYLPDNYLTGTIPSTWATMNLKALILSGNLLSGTFPTTLTRITTLEYLDIRGNRFSGPLPPELSKLKNLNYLDISSNEFTGELPVGLAKLTNLTHMIMSDNNFSGKIPNFISQWTQIEKLFIMTDC